jgi:hypothetical protein
LTYQRSQHERSRSTDYQGSLKAKAVSIAERLEGAARELRRYDIKVASARVTEVAGELQRLAGIVVVH